MRSTFIVKASQFLFLKGPWFLFFSIYGGSFVAQENLIPEINNLVQGRIYDPEYLHIEGSQFLEENRMIGKVFLLNDEYNALLLDYDIFADDLVYYPESKQYVFYPLELTKEFVSYFTLEERFFINTENSRYHHCGLKSGYYEVISEGFVSLLIKRRLEVVTKEAQEYFIRRDAKYLVKENNYNRVRNKKSILAFIGKKYKKQLTNFLNKNSIVLSRASDEEWESTIIFLNALLQSSQIHDDT